MKRLIAHTLGFGLLALAASASANLLSNGDFEDPFNPNAGNWGAAPGGTNGTGFFTLGNGATALNGWIVGDVSIDVVFGPYAHFGNYGVDLAGTPGPGSILQNVSTGAGLYQLTFYARYDGNAVNSHLNIAFGSYSGLTVVGTTWQQYSILVTPGASASTLFSMATDPNNTTNGNLFIDNVEINAVPEPVTLGLISCSALAGLLRIRRRRAISA